MTPSARWVAKWIGGSIAVMALIVFDEWSLYFHPEHFRPESQHFSVLRVFEAVLTTIVMAGAGYWLLRTTRISARTRYIIFMSFGISWTNIVSWVVAEQGISTGYVVRGILLRAAIVWFLSAIWPSWFGVRPIPKES